MKREPAPCGLDHGGTLKTPVSETKRGVGVDDRFRTAWDGSTTQPQQPPSNSEGDAPLDRGPSPSRSSQLAALSRQSRSPDSLPIRPFQPEREDMDPYGTTETSDVEFSEGVGQIGDWVAGRRRRRRRRTQDAGGRMEPPGV